VNCEIDFKYFFIFLNFRFWWVIREETNTYPENTKSSVGQKYSTKNLLRCERW